MNKACRKRILKFMEGRSGEFSAVDIHDWMKESGLRIFPSARDISAILARMPEVRRIGPKTWVSAEAVQ